jgi:uncharacterized protein
MKTLPLYAALLALLFVALSVRTLRLRRSLKIGLGDAGNAQMLRAVRVHANFAEYAPLGLLLVYMVEVQGAPSLLVHALGACLVLGRASHAYGVSQTKENYRFRVAGMAMTFTVLVSSALYLLFVFARAAMA